MKFSFTIPTRIYFGKEAIKKNSGIIAGYGKRAIIVTGRHSARACGALSDVEDSLAHQEIPFILYDEIENNPSIETIEKAAEAAKAFGADMVIGIGGGSPMDASKAIAVLAANPQMAPMELFQNQFHKVLPVIAVPTTSGTGSEVTPYSVLLVKEKETKLSFGTWDTIPKCAFLDVSYTMELNRETTIHTAVDAFTHSLEGFLGCRSMEFSDCLALEGMRLFGECAGYLTGGDSSSSLAVPGIGEEEAREKLMYASLLGGMVIAQSGVTVVHGMGYCYTYFRGIPHGKANGLLLKTYLQFIMDIAEEKIKKALTCAGYASIEALSDDMEKMLGRAPELNEGEISHYTQLTLLQKGSLGNTVHPMKEETIRYLWMEVQKNS